MLSRLSGALLLGSTWMCAGVAVGYAITSVPVLLVLGAFVAIVMFGVTGSRTLVCMAVVLVSALGLLRRLSSGGRVDYDPLLLVPLALFALAFLKHRRTATLDSRLIVFGMTGLGSILVVASLINGLSASSGYALGMTLMCLTLMIAPTVGWLPDIWAILYRLLPALGLVLATYGIVQFFILPRWDASWMIASGLESIGQPFPMYVRVFGTAEAPGAFSFLLSVCVIVAGYRAMDTSFGLSSRLLCLTSIPVISVALFLTGVRTAIVAVLLAVAITAAARRSPKLILGCAIATVAVVLFLSFGVGQLSGTESQTFSARRYTEFGGLEDSSVRARLALVEVLEASLTSPLGSGFGGSGNSVKSVDNAIVNMAVVAGPLAFLLFLTVYLVLLVRIVRGMGLVRTLEDQAAMSAAFVGLVYLQSGNLTISTTGLLLSYIVGIGFLRQSKCVTNEDCYGESASPYLRGQYRPERLNSS
ncbi:hypothetical protein [Nocardioides bruguierae]|uniref:O-antigen ligase domain-containing protein n=1 Tax=Nocardioides bruguierae TaxID=2945102 RepID=A0A9X2IGR0_9ACTN|nr:hypothetical protein [Nocardioides bruguierae]MCM0621834.1 hypothetical protein [Nocardioides bruguierae]